MERFSDPKSWPTPALKKLLADIDAELQRRERDDSSEAFERGLREALSDYQRRSY